MVSVPKRSSNTISTNNAQPLTPTQNAYIKGWVKKGSNYYAHRLFLANLYLDIFIHYPYFLGLIQLILHNYSTLFVEVLPIHIFLVRKHTIILQGIQYHQINPVVFREQSQGFRV